MILYVGYKNIAQRMNLTMHSKWAEENPVYGDACSFIKRNVAEGLWFSANCSVENTVICMDKNRPIYMLPSEAETTTHMYQYTGQQFNRFTTSNSTGTHKNTSHQI